MQVPLLPQLARVRVPYGSSLVGAAAQQQGAFAAPLEAEDGALVAFQRPDQLACAWCGLSRLSRVLCRRGEGLEQGSSLGLILCQPCPGRRSLPAALHAMAHCCYLAWQHDNMHLVPHVDADTKNTALNQLKGALGHKPCK